MNKQVLIITGPTGVGKTDLVDKVAELIPSEIVNLDLGQFYNSIAIGTAMPNWQNHKVKHHLFGILNEPKNFTVFQYRKLVIDTVQQIWENNKLPILVGGSGFYLLSLFFPPIEGSLSAEPIQDYSWDMLNKLDPARAMQIKKTDTYRIQRAISIALAGLEPSKLKPKFNPFCSAKIIVLTRDRKDLYDRINLRTKEMFDAGWINEVSNLSEDWKNFLISKKLIGYDDIIKYINQAGDDNQKLIEIIRQKTRNYAKRQLTFFRMLERKLKEQQSLNCHVTFDWLDLTLSDLDLYIKQLRERYKKGEVF